jgi:adenylosuccinate synthase
MSVKIVVGAQWGDEGKGKIVDYLAKDSDILVRFQGGDNAGHTVSNEHGVFKLHLVPCGIFYPNVTCIAGTGMVINPHELLKEMQEIEHKGVSTKGLKISSRAIILMPYHVDLDSLKETGSDIIGTTKRGIGPAYADRAERSALRFEDLKDLDYCKYRIQKVLPLVNAKLKFLGGKPYTIEEIYQLCELWSKELSDRIIDQVYFLNKAIKENKNILFEGQLGVMKDLDLGIYPYVTSSNPVASYAPVSAGIPFQKIDQVIGVFKAFSSAVGAGPFPTEMDDVVSNSFRGTGEFIDDEFGARTGRARRIGWLDIPILQYGAMINGYTDFAMCKLDKLDTLDEIQICIGYTLCGNQIDYMPNTKELDLVKPIYITLPGWKQSTKHIRSIHDLPIQAKNYIKTIESYTNIKITYVGVGPSREQLAL